ncbi:pyrroloquinoline quinone biosynthesis protein PqqB [Streptomyces sp. MMG1121]|uniref:pyrroloquinoline quinone biosynthesis protein PqqB n=1 Tax=Streptomyces sp. MMG1121 TaxID=1415544 RepID=UPI0006C09074|nr:pyrroloquinoline quinone biosynthesis protein PqqB [Streptomyces sp. MMG1121]KOV57285.1 pyrroloquinoline quinone biosynthesis protein PqqB [Streptomyces sp. MMG1121]
MVVRVVLLGTAAGGGFPQWNCACELCTAARDGRLPSRTQECAAVTGNGRDWWLLNASPDLRTQLTTTPALRPGPGPRDTPLRGVLLTDAEADHVMGLTELRGAAGLKVYAAPPVRAVLAPVRAALDRYAPWEWADSLAAGGFVLAGGLVVTAHPVGAKIPKYVPAQAPGPAGPWVTAYRIEDLASGGVLVYAPCVGAWSAELDELCAEADCVLLDGTFFAADEMGTTVRSGAGQAAMGHLPVTGPEGTIAALARHLGARRVYTHLNNTNPLLDPASPARARAAEEGIEVLPDGAELVL